MLEAGFILLTITLALILFACASNLAGQVYTRISEERQFKTRAMLILTLWLAYITLLSVKGVFVIATFPPRIPLLLIIPAFLFFGYLFTSRKFKKIIEKTPPSWPVYFQSFRIVVELLILGLFTKGILPKTATFEGYNYDILIGITAPLVGYFISNRRPSRLFVLVWNTAGLLTLSIVVFILLSHAYFYQMMNEQEGILTKGLGVFPYIFLAGFYMPLAVFMHIFSIIRSKELIR